MASADLSPDLLFLLHLARFPGLISRHCWLSGEGDIKKACPHSFYHRPSRRPGLHLEGHLAQCTAVLHVPWWQWTSYLLMAEWPLGARKGRSSEDTDPQIHPQTLGRRCWRRGVLKDSCRPGMAVGLTCVLPNLSTCYAARGQGFPDTHPGPGEERVGGKQRSLHGREGGKGSRQSVRLRATQLHPWCTVSWHFSGAWHRVWHTAVAQ